MAEAEGQRLRAQGLAAIRDLCPIRQIRTGGLCAQRTNGMAMLAMRWDGRRKRLPHPGLAQVREIAGLMLVVAQQVGYWLIAFGGMR